MATTDIVLPGNTHIFEIPPDWEIKPISEKKSSYEVFQSDNGAHYAPKTKETEEATISFTVKAYGEDISKLLIFFAARRGRYSGFWLPIPQKEFFCDSIDASKCVLNGNVTPDYLYIIDANENVWARKVTNSYDAVNNETTATFDSGLSTTPTVSYLVFELTYVRFDSDVIDYNYYTSKYAEVSLNFRRITDEL